MAVPDAPLETQEAIQSVAPDSIENQNRTHQNSLSNSTQNCSVIPPKCTNTNPATTEAFKLPQTALLWAAMGKARRRMKGWLATVKLGLLMRKINPSITLPLAAPGVIPTSTTNTPLPVVDHTEHNEPRRCNQYDPETIAIQKPKPKSKPPKRVSFSYCPSHITQGAWVGWSSSLNGPSDSSFDTPDPVGEPIYADVLETKVSQLYGTSHPTLEQLVEQHPVEPLVPLDPEFGRSSLPIRYRLAPEETPFRAPIYLNRKNQMNHTGNEHYG
ncbi:hypothetical protein FQN57_003814 [Myotisia sp. PD_48]|nr:hypothetical protein FQN57_003814 [Myotisia sp. PD_48]